ncbi:MAG: DUF805 domain-containing protein [Gammaproteobacteria bacterium]|nr:DUF805 domain-containing protein [Gammaproteobacteria bacterium]
MSWFLRVLRNYFVVEGRARRKEYWFFFLFAVIFSIGFAIVDVLFGTFDPETGYGLFQGLYSLAILIPSITVGVRRLHDTDRSGWWLLIGLLPILGAIVLIVFFVLPGTRGSNRFGPDPLGEPATGVVA